MIDLAFKMRCFGVFGRKNNCFSLQKHQHATLREPWKEAGWEEEEEDTPGIWVRDRTRWTDEDGRWRGGAHPSEAQRRAEAIESFDETVRRNKRDRESVRQEAGALAITVRGSLTTETSQVEVREHDEDRAADGAAARAQPGSSSR